ncbi:hypothetical protein MSAN_01651800 [Mycena sanguinolenta]|uniref:rRNA-processing protein EFG1 n=1 Tax=Mycena sanguinolenta TaxID=230812 RepID=A0A8H6Y1D5_9AGAR|nr:hypothetical protein MSAN_01651800 [Mycena sanguinolenta]
MGPVRTKKSRRDAIEASSSAAAGPSKSKPRKPKQAQQSNGTPGIQKIKSSLRQTRRLLAKDNLAPDVRVETERRLKALEADLEAAELGKKERTLAVRYHKVKFFERQKVVRKLNQAKKKLSDSDTPELRSALQELRIDLNYILHYPKTKKYISLFPPELRHGETQELAVDAGREEVRAWVRTQMEKGELSAEPELHLDARGNSGATDWGSEKKKPKNQPDPEADVDSDDEFFEDDDEDQG